MFYLKMKSMKKLVSLFLCMALLLSMVVWAEPVKTCQEAGELIADTEYEEVYFECSNSLSPVELLCAAGMVFVEILKMCVNEADADGLYWVCKTPKNGSYGCHRGNMISFRPSCVNKKCSK